MIPRGAEEIEDGGPHGERSAENVDQFAGLRADDLGAEDAAALGFGDDLHVAVVGVHEDGLAVVIERIGGDEEFFAAFGEFGFLHADGGERRFGEHDVE